jgi:hypothetical protein
MLLSSYICNKSLYSAMEKSQNQGRSSYTAYHMYFVTIYSESLIIFHFLCLYVRYCLYSYSAYLVPAFFIKLIWCEKTIERYQYEYIIRTEEVTILFQVLLVLWLLKVSQYCSGNATWTQT